MTYLLIVLTFLTIGVFKMALTNADLAKQASDLNASIQQLIPLIPAKPDQPSIDAAAASMGTAKTAVDAAITALS